MSVKRLMICFMCAVTLLLSACKTEVVVIKPTPVPTEAIADETEEPAAQETPGFDNISAEEKLRPTPTPSPAPTSTPPVLQMVEVDASGAPTLNESVPIQGDTEYNEAQTEKMRQMAVDYGKITRESPPYCETYVESFRNAVWPQAGDYSEISANMPDWLYEQPVNRWTGVSTTDSDSLYETNSEVISSIGRSEAEKLCETAKRFMELDALYDYETDTKESIAIRLALIFPAGYDYSQNIEDIYGNVMAKELKTEAFILTDPTLVYRDSEGQYRVKCSVFKHILHATAALFQEMECTSGTWREVDVEVVFGESNGSFRPLYYNTVTPYYNMTDTPANRAILTANGYAF